MKNGQQQFELESNIIIDGPLKSWNMRIIKKSCKLNKTQRNKLVSTVALSFLKKVFSPITLSLEP